MAVLVCALAVGCAGAGGSAPGDPTGTDADAGAKPDLDADGGMPSPDGGESSRGTGASTAICTPSPCTATTATNGTLSVDDGAGKQVDRTYSLYRPKNLTNSETNKAPLVVVFDSSDVAGWESLAAAERFVVLYLGVQGRSGYATPVITPNYTSVAAAMKCGASGHDMCDDGPWINAVLDVIIPSQNIDRDKVFATGGSKGGSMTEEMICDPAVSGRFRGFVAVSAVFISPGGNAAALPNCPALRTHRDLSVEYQYGTADSAYSGNSDCKSNCLQTGFVNAKGHWVFSQSQIMTLILNPLLGCPAEPQTTSFGTPDATNQRDLYSPCAMPFRATSLITIPGGGHTSPGLDGINGFDSIAEAWSFLSSH